MSQPQTFLCISFYFKGVEFIKACHQAGNTVYLLTKKALEKEPWPHESLADIFYMDSEANTPVNYSDMERGLAFLMRSIKIDRIVALDDFDVEKAAFLREQFRIPGMGQTTARYFRDKLAMRTKAEEGGLRVPPFSSLFHDHDIHHFTALVAPPWVVKPRSEASATGIRKVHSADELWRVLEQLGDERHRYLVEQFKPGDVYHADSLTVKGEVIFCRVSKYLNPPFDVAHGGGIFRSHTLEFEGPDDVALQAFNRNVIKAFGLQFSASHTEFIKAQDDGQFYFLETSSRVGGAHIAEMIEASSGINLWAEWARIETAMAEDRSYQLPEVRRDHAGILISLSRFKHPDQAAFSAPEIVWRLQKDYHVGLIVRSDQCARILHLLDQYVDIIYKDYHASAPAPEKPPN